MSVSDQDLLRRWVRRQDAEAFRELTVRHSAMVHSVSARILRDASSAEDIAQECFQRLAVDSDPRAVRSLAGWLFRVATNLSLNELRARGRRRERELAAAAERERSKHPDWSEIRTHVDEALAELPDESRTVLVLHFIENRTHASIARDLGVSRGTVTYRIQRGLERVRRALERRGVFVPAAVLGGLFGEHLLAGGVPSTLAASLGRLAIAGTGRGNATGTPSIITASEAATSSAAATSSRVLGAVALGGAVVMAKKLIVASGLIVGAVLIWSLSSGLDGPGSPAAHVASPVAPSPLQRRAAPPPPVEIVDGPSVKDAPEPMPERSAVFGVVRDWEALPVSGVVVRLVASIDEETAVTLLENGYGDVSTGESVRETVTDAQGAYRFDEVFPAPAKIYAEAESAVLCWPPSVQLAPGEILERDVRLCPERRVTGRVVATDGTPITHAEVLLDINCTWTCVDRPRSGNYRVFPVDEEGRFDSGNCVAQRDPMAMPALARADGFATRPFRFDWKHLSNGIVHSEVILDPERRVRLRVVDSDGAPIEAAEVSGYVPNATAQTDAQGDVLLSGLSKKSTDLRIDKEGYFRATVRVDTTVEVEVSHVVRMTRLTPPVRGRVVFHEPLVRPESIGFSELWIFEPEQRVRIYGSPSRETLEYAFHPPRPGTYRIVLGQGPHSARTEPFTYDATTELEVNLDVRLEPPYVMGRVESGDGAPLAAVKIRGLLGWGDELDQWSCAREQGFAFPFRSGNSLWATSDEDGRFLIDSPPFGGQGSFRLRLRAGSKEMGWSEDVALDLGNSSRVDDVVLTVRRPGTIAGTLIDGEGRPRARYVVAAYNGEMGPVDNVTDDSGNYRIEGLRPGRYMVLPLGPHRHIKLERESFPSGEHGDPRAHLDFPVEVEAGEVTQLDLDLDLDRDAAGSIVGRVSGIDVDPLLVRCAAIEGDGLSASSLFGRRSEVIRGEFRFRNLLSAPYLVWLESTEQERAAEAIVTVVRAQATDVELGAGTAALEISIEDEVDLERVTVPEITGESLGSRELVRWAGYEVVRSKDGDGLRIEGLPGTIVRACVLAPGFQETWTEPVDLSGAIHSAEISVKLRRGQRLHVRPQIGASDPIPEGVKFSVYSVDEERDCHVTSVRNDDGTWTISALEPGEYRLTVRPGRGYASVQREIVVAAREHSEVEIDVRREGS